MLFESQWSWIGRESSGQMIQVATVFGSNLSAQPFRLAAYRSRLLSSGHFVYILRVCRLHYSTAHNHFIIVAPNLNVLYTSPHPEIQPHPIHPLIASRCYICLWDVILYANLLSWDTVFVLIKELTDCDCGSRGDKMSLFVQIVICIPLLLVVKPSLQGTCCIDISFLWQCDNCHVPQVTLAAW